LQGCDTRCKQPHRAAQLLASLAFADSSKAVQRGNRIDPIELVGAPLTEQQQPLSSICRGDLPVEGCIAGRGAGDARGTPGRRRRRRPLGAPPPPVTAALWHLVESTLVSWFEITLAILTLSPC